MNKYVDLLVDTAKKLDVKLMQLLSDKLFETYARDGTIYVFGNGGSAENSSHFVGDLVKGCSIQGKKRIKAMSLSDNKAAVLAIANDISYDDIFSEQLKNFLKEGDFVVGVSGSGNSPNVLKAVEYANEHGVETFGLTGFSGGKLGGLAKYHLNIPIHDMEQTENLHLFVMHAVKMDLIQRIMQ